MDLGKTVQLNNSIEVLQLYDSSIFQMGGPGGVRHLPKPDFHGAYRSHIDGTLQIADKAAVKEMTVLFFPLKKALGQAKKALLAPLTGYRTGLNRAVTIPSTISTTLRLPTSRHWGKGLAWESWALQCGEGGWHRK
jgi:hypothetical protein